MALYHNYTYVNLLSIIVVGLILMMFWLLRTSWFAESGQKALFAILGLLIAGHLAVSFLGTFDYPSGISDEIDFKV